MKRSLANIPPMLSINRIAEMLDVDRETANRIVKRWVDENGLRLHVEKSFGSKGQRDIVRVPLSELARVWPDIVDSVILKKSMVV